MQDLSKKQEAVREFIADELLAGRVSPSHREIAAHFGFASTYAAACHVRALLKKGSLVADAGKARSLRLAESSRAALRATVAQIPLFGTIPAGYGSEREQEADGCVSVDVDTIGFKPTPRTFALRVAGDSMIGRHICDGDIVILEHGGEPRNGQIVAALIDGKSTLKTFVVKNGRPFLRAENPKYPNLVPSGELMIQGVFRALVRRAKE